MGGETRAELLFRSLWKHSQKSPVGGPEKVGIGILSFEVASLMSKLVNIWQCLEDRQIMRLRREISTSPGIQMFISEDDDYLMDLAHLEVMENVGCVARAVVLLGKRCTDPTYHHLKQVFDDPVEIGLNWCGWEYRLKKMERKVKKMERFVAVTSQLQQELDVLAEHEQTLKRMRANPESSQVKLLEFQQKVMCQRQEVKNLREMSPWVRTYDYTVRLLLRSIFTIVARIKFVCGINQWGAVEKIYGSIQISKICLVRSNSISDSTQYAVHLSENNLFGINSRELGRSCSNLGMAGEKDRSNSRKLNAWHNRSIFGGKKQQKKTIRFAHIGPFHGCMTGSDSPALKNFMASSSNILRSDCASHEGIEMVKNSKIWPVSHCSINFKHKQLNAPPSTLGYAALALHYANIIILIERLVSSPHLISMDARDDLYNMLPTSIRTSLRAKLKVFTQSSASSVYDAVLEAEWRLTLSRILDWLSQLAHNTIKWYSERNFEKQDMTSGTNVLLVQTLYFADQAKTEAAIAKLLMGLNYLSRFYKQLHEQPFLDSSCKRACDVYVFDTEYFPKHDQSHNVDVPQTC
ncbi:unnamed protein product [Coffea canephora]|uniref:DUF668 domain-containing protein n=1 Tax=Coffea canephora TaxID=49390 RepID=A0A068V3V8_COFCA|nr:unnamed protein product [Coffea canephora]